MILGGSVTTTKSLELFTPMSRMRIVEAVTDLGSFEGRLALAQRAAGWRLLEPAGRHAQAAIDLAAAREDGTELIAGVRKWAADALEAAIVRSVREGELEYAQHCLKLLTTRLASERSEERLDALAGAVEGLEAELRAARLEARQKGREAAKVRALAKQLEAVEERLALGDRRLRDAIAASRTTVKSARLAEDAIAAYRAAWKAAEALLVKTPADLALAEEVALVGERAMAQMVRASLHVSSVLTVQSDYKGALAWTDRVLEVEPENAEALELRRTIQTAATACDAWCWGWWIPGNPLGGLVAPLGLGAGQR